MINKLILVLTVVVTSILPLSYNSCTLEPPRGTQVGDPMVELSISSFSPTLGQDFTLCIGEIKLKAEDQAVLSSVAFASQSRALNPEGTELGFFRVPRGSFVEARLSLSNACGSGNTLSFTKSEATLATGEIFDLTFTGYIKIGVDNSRIVFNMSNILGDISSAATGSEIAQRAVASFGIVTSDSGSAPLIVEKVYPSNGARWNDYVENFNGGTSNYDQPDAPCTGIEPQGYQGCIHGAEILKFVVPFENSCLGLALRDQLSAFDWICAVRDGQVVFYSKGLKENHGLKDLVDATSWRLNRVILTKYGSEILASQPSSWWSNSVVELTTSFHSESAPALALDQASTVYTISSSRLTNGYNLAADRVALVTLGSSVLRFNPALTQNSCDTNGELSPAAGGLQNLLCAGNQKFLWLEGRYRGGGPAEGNRFVNISHSRFHKLTVYDFSGGDFANAALDLIGSNSNLVSFVDIANNTSNGLRLRDSSRNQLFNLHFAQNIERGIMLNDVSTQNRFQKVLVSNGVREGIYLPDATTINNSFVEILVVNNAGTGVREISSSNNTFSHLTLAQNQTGISLNSGGTASQILAVNNQDRGISFGSSGLFSQMAAVSNDRGFQITPTSTQNAIYGNLFVGANATADCALATSDVTNLINITCDHGTGLATPAIPVGSIASSFMGKVLLDSTNLAEDSAGQTPFATLLSQSIEWLKFDNPFRSWGKSQAAAFPSPTHQLNCSSGEACQIWDWRLQATDINFLNRNGVLSSAACPAAVTGTGAEIALTDQQTVNPNTYLINAVEIALDHSGDEDGLCESGETCVFSPHIGVYQGDDPIDLSTSCLFTDGTVNNVRLHSR